MSEFWRGRKVLVTGATGMVGSWLVKELLAKDASVTVLIRDSDPRSELYRSGDIHDVSVVNGVLEDFWTVERAINEHEVDTVFHLGAQTLVGVAHRFPVPTFEANLRGTYHVLEACRLHRDLVRWVVIASSDKAYGAQASLPYREDMPLQGRHPYDVSKSCADLIAQAYVHTYALPVAIARCGNIYGGGDLNWSRIVPGTIRSFLDGARPVIRSDGTFVRDYIYVKDVVQAFLRLAESHGDARVQGQAFNFSTESPVTVLDMVGAIRSLMNCGHLEPDIRNSAVGEIRAQHLSAERAHTILGWRPQYSLPTGLAETIEWYGRYLAGERERRGARGPA